VIDTKSLQFKLSLKLGALYKANILEHCKANRTSSQ